MNYKLHISFTYDEFLSHDIVLQMLHSHSFQLPLLLFVIPRFHGNCQINCMKHTADVPRKASVVHRYTKVFIIRQCYTEFPVNQFVFEKPVQVKIKEENINVEMKRSTTLQYRSIVCFRGTNIGLYNFKNLDDRRLKGLGGWNHFKASITGRPESVEYMGLTKLFEPS